MAGDRLQVVSDGWWLVGDRWLVTGDGWWVAGGWWSKYKPLNDKKKSLLILSSYNGWTLHKLVENNFDIKLQKALQNLLIDQEYNHFSSYYQEHFKKCMDQILLKYYVEIPGATNKPYCHHPSAVNGHLSPANDHPLPATHYPPLLVKYCRDQSEFGNN